MRLGAAIAIPLVLIALSGCTASDPLSEQYADGSGQGYISSDGAQTEIPPNAREDAIDFSATGADGEAITASDFAGSVYVVNFWYAGCPPCRTEAPDLKALSEEYLDVPFLGVNTTDSADVVKTFEDTFGIAYPSVLDANTAGVQLAFAGAVAPNAVPTTLVVDREGRVAARISGLIRDPSILAAMIESVAAEGT